MKRPTFIGNIWNVYEEIIIPGDVRELAPVLRHAYYAGASSILRALKRLGEETNASTLTDDQAGAALTIMEDECEAFFNEYLNPTEN